MKNHNSIKEILTPSNFSKIADVIYSEFISYSEYKDKHQKEATKEQLDKFNERKSNK